MHDELIDIINAYIESVQTSPTAKLLHRRQFLDKMEKSFNTSDLKPTYGSVRLTNDAMVTMPVFDMKAMILSIIHDEQLMRDENFASGLDIFTGAVDRVHEDNYNYGEFHTGDAWKCAVKRIVGTSKKYMPLGLVVFADKSHTDQHGTLSLTPVTFTATFFNRAVRNNPDAWRPMGYIPNLTHANVGGTNSSTKSQSEHYCIAYVLKSLIDLSEAGGIRTEVMGKLVHIKPFIHVFVGDTEGFNKWLGHYNSSQPGVSRPYRDCHCSFNDLSLANPVCEYTKAIEFRRALRMAAKKGLEKTAKQYFKLQSRHNINNALYQARLPLSDGEYGANRMCPPELLHTLDAGLTIYILESLQDLISGGSCRVELDYEHRRMYRALKWQSERDIPRGAIRSGLIETTRCQSSERKGNLFILLCIAHTTGGELILHSELGLNKKDWQHWLLFLQMYLAMGEWFHDSRPKDEVRDARTAVAAVVESLKKFFPRKRDSNGYNIPKLHGLTKVQYYMCLFGSAINFYGGPGEASHKKFVKAPGTRTQRRVAEFATQTADQYYAIMTVDRVTRFVDTRLPKEKLKDDTGGEERIESNRATGKYVVQIFPDGRNVVKSDNKQLTDVGIDENVLRVFRREAMQHDDWDGFTPVTITGYTHANVVGNDGECISYNAHPCYHGAPWYDWAHVHYAVEQADGEVEQQYYPSKVLGFMTTSNGVEAIIQYSVEEVTWEQLEDDFVVPFHLCIERDKEDVVPLSSLCNPICVVPDYGNREESNKYLMILPKGHWSGVFTTLM